jgi:transcriptional regulator with XRE-family HTH domain
LKKEANMDDAWRRQLRTARGKLGLSQRTVAEAARISLETVRAYENGRRHPTRQHLDALLAALDVPRAEANGIIEGAGFAPPRTLFPTDRYPDYFYSAAELPKVVEQVAWPEFVTNDAMELVAVNAAAAALWGIDFHHERRVRTRAQLNVLAVASQNRFADRVANWEEVVGTMASVFKGRPREAESLDEPSTYLGEVLAEFSSGDPAFLERLIRIWAGAEPAQARCRWSYRVVWRDAEFGEMRFLGIVSTASEPDALGFNDWHPVDAGTWTVLEAVKERAAGNPK